MATATSLDPEVGIESPDIETYEPYEVVDGVIVEDPALGAYEIRMANRLVKTFVLFDPPGTLGEAVIEVIFLLKQSPSLRRRPDVAFMTQERWPRDRPMPQEAA